MVKGFNRDYGLPDSTPVGTPKVVGAGPICPNCGCQTFIVELEVEQKLLHGGKGIGVYAGCPACQYASQMVVRSA